MMLLDEFPVRLLDIRGIRARLEPERSISGSITGHRQPV
jgi:hypothetical protein